MGNGQLADRELDAMLALQFLVAWAGEGLCQPKRLDWWRTDLIDEDGGGYFLQALFPKTHQWAAFEAVRKAAIQHDRQTRLNMADPDSIRTLFFWGFHIDEQLDDRLAQHKRNEHQLPLEAGSDGIAKDVIDWVDRFSDGHPNEANRTLIGDRKQKKQDQLEMDFDEALIEEDEA